MLKPSLVTTRRPGSISPLFLLSFPLLLTAFAVAVEVSSLHHRQLELQVSTDAAALSAATALVPTDDILFATATPAQGQSVWNRLLTESRAEARFYALANRMRGTGVELAEDEISFRPLDEDTPAFHPQSPFPPGPEYVDITLRRDRVAAHATAFIDRHVRGFKVQGSSHRLVLGGPAAIPVLPIAIKRQEWERAILQRQGTDNYRLNWLERRNPRSQQNGTNSDDSQNPQDENPGLPEDRQEVPGIDQTNQDNQNNQSTSDGIRELTLRFTEGSGGSSASIVQIGTLRNAASQVLTGLMGEDLRTQPVPGQLLLQRNPTTQLNQLPLAVGGTGNLADLADALQSLIGKKRIWLLTSQEPGAQVIVDGFVAARIMDVRFGEVKDDDKSKGEKDSQKKRATALEVVLQPTFLVTPTAVTDRTPAPGAPAPLWNPYICKIRLLK